MQNYGYDQEFRLRCAGARTQHDQERRTAQIVAAGGLDAWMKQQAARRDSPRVAPPAATHERELAVA